MVIWKFITFLKRHFPTMKRMKFIKKNMSNGLILERIILIILIHIQKDILDQNGQIDPNKLKLVGRLGADWYCQGFGDALFKLSKPNSKTANKPTGPAPIIITSVLYDI